MLAVVDLKERVPRGHPLRTVKQLADAALAELSGVFDQMYALARNPSPEPPPQRITTRRLTLTPGTMGPVPTRGRSARAGVWVM